MFLAGVELEALGCALRDRQPVAVSGLRIIELSGVATAAAREIRELRAQLEASQIEVQGMRAALDGHAGTHSPYLWKGPAEHHSAWLSGQQAVQKYGADRYQMGYQKAQEVAAIGQNFDLYAQKEAWTVVEAIAAAEPPIGAQEARAFAQKALCLAQGGTGDQA